MGGLDTDDGPDAVVVDELWRTFAGRLSRRTIADAVGQAAQELQGQVPPGARRELLHRLAVHRLGGWAAAR